MIIILVLIVRRLLEPEAFPAFATVGPRRRHDQPGALQEQRCPGTFAMLNAGGRFGIQERGRRRVSPHLREPGDDHRLAHAAAFDLQAQPETKLAAGLWALTDGSLCIWIRTRRIGSNDDDTTGFHRCLRKRARAEEARGPQPAIDTDAALGRSRLRG
jgi:hypothetical protein